MTTEYDDWLFGAVSAVALAATFGAHLLAAPITPALAAERTGPDYKIIVTAKRKPAECKLAAHANTPKCTKPSEQTVEFIAQ